MCACGGPATAVRNCDSCLLLLVVLPCAGCWVEQCLVGEASRWVVAQAVEQQDREVLSVFGGEADEACTMPWWSEEAAQVSVRGG